MKKHKLYTTLFSIIILTSACSNHEAIQDGVIKSNLRTDMVLSNYQETKNNSSLVETIILESIQLKDITGLNSLELLGESPELKEDIGSSIMVLAQTVNSYIEERNTLAREQEESKQISTEDKITNIPDFISSITKVHYFLDDKTGKVEQMFLIKLPNGYIGSVSVLWLGGSIIDYTAFNLD